MSFVNLVSGGIDSTLIAFMAKELDLAQLPLFIDYGQIAAEKEWDTCVRVHKDLKLPDPMKINLSGFGQAITSGLTNASMHVKEEAFTPGRNLLFLLMASSVAYQHGLSKLLLVYFQKSLVYFLTKKMIFYLVLKK